MNIEILNLIVPQLIAIVGYFLMFASKFSKMEEKISQLESKVKDNQENHSHKHNEFDLKLGKLEEKFENWIEKLQQNTIALVELKTFFEAQKQNNQTR